jgi:hypothetical protein
MASMRRGFLRNTSLATSGSFKNPEVALDAVLVFVQPEDLRAALLVGGHIGQQDEAAGLLPQLFDGCSVFDNTCDHPVTPPQKTTRSVFRRLSPGVDRTRREGTREVMVGAERERLRGRLGVVKTEKLLFRKKPRVCR